MTRIGRNDICYCGSGKKYKKCCLLKDMDSKPKIEESKNSNVTLSSIFEVLEFGLSKLDILSQDSRKVKVKKIDTLDRNTIQCQFYSYYSDSNDIKLEIATIMGFLHGFFKDDYFLEVFEPKFFAARAYSGNDKEILYAISSVSAAAQIGEGKSIEWLKATLFQENTNDYRLGIAKKQISEIENALRTVITDILTKRHGTDWWDKSVGDKLSNSVKTEYERQFGELINDGEILIKYSYLIQLKKIICTNWKDFKHLFESKIEFENSLDTLNLIRREEAHNREITEEHIDKLKSIYNFIFPVISNDYPQIIPELLVENWRSKVKEIVSVKYKPLFEGDDLVNEPDQQIKLTKSTSSVYHLIKYITRIEEQLNSLIVPVQKRKIHNELLAIYSNNRLLQENLIEFASKGMINELEETALEIDNYKFKMDSFIEKFLLEEG